MIRILPLFLLSFSVLRADPVLVVAEPHFDFGEKRTGEVVRHEFILQNTGNETLNIRDIRTSCGCTTPETKAMSIPAGKARALKVEMDLHGRRGAQTQHVTLSTNDPEQPAVSLKLTGSALPDIQVTPRTLNLMQTDPDASPVGTVKLVSTTGEAFEILSAEGNRDRVTAEVVMAEDEKSAEIRVSPRPQKGDGRFTDVLLIRTSSKQEPETKVLVMWQISTGISVAPGQVNLILREERVLMDRYLMVRGYPGLKEPLKVTAVEWPGHDVEIGISDVGKLGWRIHLKRFAPTADMDGSEIRIHTNAEGFETLNVPVRVLKK